MSEGVCTFKECDTDPVIFIDIQFADKLLAMCCRSPQTKSRHWWVASLMPPHSRWMALQLAAQNTCSYSPMRIRSRQRKEPQVYP